MYRMEESPARPLTKEGWAANEDFLFGVDLFNAGYFWEAHTFWERLWALGDTPPEIRRVLRSIIQTAAACLKVRQERHAGARKLLDRAQLESFDERELGIDLPALAREARRFAEGEGEPPRIHLAAADER
jgi:hypothetical protein